MLAGDFWGPMSSHRSKFGIRLGRNRGRALFAIAVVVLLAASYGVASSAESHASAARLTADSDYDSTTYVLQESNIAFTGNPITDFAGDLIYHNSNTTQWGSANNITNVYAAYNSTQLFLGLNGSADGNSVMFFISNETNSGYGTNNISDLPAWSGHDIDFTTPINYLAAVYSGGANSGWNGQGVWRITSNVDVSGTTSQTNVSIANSWGLGTNGYEVAINWSGLFPEGFQGSVGLQISVVVAGGGAWLGMGAPYAQKGAYNAGGSQPYFLLNDTFSVVAPDVVQHTFQLANQSLTFTGNVVNDFSGDLLYFNSNTTQWGAANNITGFYAAYNATDLFLGLNASASGNSVMFFISNETQSGLGTTNITGLAAWSGHDFNFTSPINYLAAVYSTGSNSGWSGENAWRVTSSVADSDSTSQTYVAINNSWDFGPDGYEVAIPWTGLFPSGLQGPAGLEVSAFVAGGDAWVGMGAPYDQIGQYNDGSSLINFEVNNTFSLLAPNLNIASSIAPPTIPISVDIIFNDHQPFYESIDSTSYYLPWTVVHLEEYAEQAIIAGEAPSVNVTYSLSGSLLYQMEAIAAGYYNNSYLQAAYIPSSQWSNSVYYEITHYGDSFLGSVVGSPDWNSTTVAQALEFDIAFNTPLWVYSAGTPAADLYDTLFQIEQSQLASGATMNTTDLSEALVEFFLWSVSYPIVSGQLGMQYANSTLEPLYQQSSFTLSELPTIADYYPVEAQLALSAFAADRMLNDGGGGNVELLTTAFDHPILPLLELNNWTDANGEAVEKGVWTNDTIAQLNIGRDLYDSIFGQYPTGLWSSEQAVSEATVLPINESGYSWTSSSENTLAEAGISTPAGVTNPTAQEMENLYTPYRVEGPTGTNANSTVMVFRDESVSNDWGFNYGSTAQADGSWAAVDEFMAYLRNVEETIPNSDHNNTLVTVALDGENWMFESPFPEDAVPFLQDLYTALAQNSSWVTSTTVQQYIATHPDLPTLSNLPIGSWNPEPTGSGINEYLGQWAGHAPQDSYWQQLTLVRSEVQAYGTTNDLTQPENLSQLSPYNDYPQLGVWNATTPEGKYTEAWTAIYLAEGSDITFSFDPDDESLTSQNAYVFETEFRTDLSTALTVLGLPLTPYLASSWVPPVTPTVWGTNASDTPVLTGSLYTTSSFTGGTGYSVNNNDAWTGAYEESSGLTASNSGTISTAYYSFDADDLFFSVAVNGPTSSYIAPNFFTAASNDLDVFFSPANPGAGNLETLAIPDAAFEVGTTPFGFAATSEATIEGSSVTPSGSASMELFDTTSAAGTWTYSSTTAQDAFVGGMLQLEVPLSDLGMVPGDSVEFMIAAVNATTGDATSWLGPLTVTVPAALAILTPVSTIHNPSPSNGPGTYTYPTEAPGGNPDYPPGSVDMQWVNVSANDYTVQFNITFGNLSNVFSGPNGFSQPIIDIYVHEPGVAGTTAGLPGVQVNLSSDSAWAWAIQAAGWASNSYVESSTGVSYSSGVIVGTNYHGTNISQPDRTVSIDVQTSIIGSAITSYTYTIVAGFQDGYATNGWDTVNVGAASDYQGGGATNDEAPYVFSYIAPAVVGEGASLTQQALLSTYTASHFATLDAISLPLLSVNRSQVVTLGASSIVNVSGDPYGFYAFGSEIFESTSTDGVTWTTPSVIANLAFVPQGLAAGGSGTPVLFAWNGSNAVLFNVAADSYDTWTAAGPIEAAALAYANGTYLLALDIGGTVTIGPPGGFALATADLGATAVGLAVGGTTSFLAYATATGVTVVPVAISFVPGDDNVTIGSETILSASFPSGATASALALAAAPNDGVVVALALGNSTGSNIFVATPTGNGTATATLTEITSDGADTSPSVLIAGSAGSYSAYVGFTSSAGPGNVFFLPISVGAIYTPPTITTTAPPPVKTIVRYVNTTVTNNVTTNTVPLWVWATLGVVIVIALIGWVVAATRGRSGGGDSGNTGSSPPKAWSPGGSGESSEGTSSEAPEGEPPASGENE